MIKITCVVPYTEKKDIIHFINKIVEDIGCPPNVLFEVLHSSSRIEENYKYWDSEIVIARGLAYSVLKTVKTNFHLIEIPISNMEIIKSFKRACQEHNAKKIALFMSKRSNIDIPLIESLCNVKAKLYIVEEDDDVIKQFNRAVNENSCDVIVGGYTVCKVATEKGYPAIPIAVGEEAARNAINEAFMAIHASHKEKQRNELLTRMMELIEEGILALDGNGTIIKINNICREILHIHDKDVEGKEAKGLIPDIILNINEEEQLIKINNNNVLIRRSPLIIDGELDANIILIQNTENIRKAEISVRQKLNKKGLIAKYTFDDIIGKNEEIELVKERAKRYAATDSDVLIVGETGTGKELFAQSIHNYSKRKKQPFVAFNCGALTPNLIESELFGYVGGAFTGAAKEGKMGLFELAHKGTIFMDEIGELPLALQVRLLRVLQEKEIRRLGDDKIIPIDVRVITATNVDLIENVKKGEFRSDLYYRLDILNLIIPSLRDRINDLDELVPFLVRNFDFNGKPIKFEKSAIEEMKKYKWEGNIRQLRNICERLSILSEDGIITRLEVVKTLSTGDNKNHMHFTDEEVELLNLVKRKQTKEELARKLGVSRSTLYRKTKNNKDNSLLNQN